MQKPSCGASKMILRSGTSAPRGFATEASSVSPSAKAYAGELACVEIHGGLGEPGRRRGRLRGVVQEAADAGHHPDRGGIPQSGARLLALARAREEEAADAAPDVPRELRLRHAGGLEVELVEDRIVGLGHHGG